MPLSRLFVPDILRIVRSEGIAPTISRSTVWRVLDRDALKPWRHRSWLWSRDPQFERRAGEVLDLYGRTWEGRPLGPGEFVLSADEKPQIQAREGTHPPEVHPDARGIRREHAYRRRGTVAYLAAWDVHRGRAIGRVEERIGKAPFDRLVTQVMTQEPYRSAQRVFWIVDNGSAHLPRKFAWRLSCTFPTAVAVHLPLHASWLNQVEIYFSIVQRKALTPSEHGSQDALARRLLDFEQHFNEQAKPFRWNFTHHDLYRILERVPNSTLAGSTPDQEL